MKKTIVLAVLVLLTGCASPCMKKPTALEQKQCKWVKRENRNVKLFLGSGLLMIPVIPFIAGHVFGKGDAPKWVAPTFGVLWGVGMFGAIDSQYIMGPYPRKAKGEKI